MTPQRLTYWSSGGEVVTAPGRPLDIDEAARLLGRHRQAGSHDLATQLRRALDAASQWRRAATATYAPGGAANCLAKSSRVLTLTASVSGSATPRNLHSGPHPCAAS